MAKIFRIMLRFFVVPGMVGAFFVACAWALGFASFLVTISVISPQDPTIKTDGIVVLTGGGDRVRTGLGLFRDHYAPRLLISGVHAKTKLNDLIAETGVIIPADLCCIDLGFDATDTIGNARETAHWAHDHHIQTVRLVTANYHMPRAFFEMKRTIPNIVIYRFPVHTDLFQIWTKTGMILVLSEYHKTLVTLMRLTREQFLGRLQS